MAIDKLEVTGDWDGSSGALQVVADKPTIKFVGGAVSGGKSWILHLSANGPGNLEFFNLGAAGWANVLSMAPSGNVGIGNTAPASKLHVVAQDGHAIQTTAAKGSGVVAESQTWHALYGHSQSTTGGAGVWAEHAAAGPGLVGKSATGIGVVAQSDSGEAVHAQTTSDTVAAVAAYNLGKGPALYGKGTTAAVFEGNVIVSGKGDIILQNADCAEDFDILSGVDAEPGTVMIIDASGALSPGDRAYDRRVAGVVSGAGDYRPALVLDSQGRSTGRRPIALIGKVYCKVDASYAPIEVGDLLTTSATSGHAMRASDPALAVGAIVGKALRPLHEGRGLIPILVALQ
jgi:hypothetical protein